MPTYHWRSRTVPWWAVLSSAMAPVAMIGGWTVAARRQPEDYDSIRQTISALAGHGALDRGIMTAGLALVGVCHLVTAAGLRPARPLGRLLLALGGLATAAVAALPLPAEGPSPAHGIAALIAFVTLALWPVIAATGSGPSPVWRLPAAGVATVVLAGLLILLGIQLQGGSHIGLVERFLAGAESGWPAVVTLSAWLVRSR